MVNRGFWFLGNLRESNHFDPLGGDGRIILKWIFKKTVRGRVLIHLTKVRDRLRAVANAVMNPWVPYKVHPCTGTEALYRPYGP